MTLFDAWGGNEALDIPKLKNLCCINIKTKDGTERFKSDTEDTVDTYNEKLLGNAILYVGTNYRNRAAHKDPVSKVLYEETKDLLISTEYLLWILMYILK